MERLTERLCNGLVCLVDGTHPCDIAMKALQRLAAYEDTWWTPEDIKVMHNELCLRCGLYKEAHLGACNGCRWRKEA